MKSNLVAKEMKRRKLLEIRERKKQDYAQNPGDNEVGRNQGDSSGLYFRAHDITSERRTLLS